MYVYKHVIFNTHKHHRSRSRVHFPPLAPQQFPCSNIERIMSKLCQALGESAREDVSPAQAVVSFERFAELLKQRAPGALSDHELRTLARYYQDRGEDAMSLETIVGIVQEQLRKANFEGFMRIADQCAHHDTEGYVHRCGVTWLLV